MNNSELSITPGYNLYAVSVTAIWENTEEFLVAAPTEQEAKQAAEVGSSLDIYDAEHTDTTSSCSAINTEVLTTTLAEAIAETTTAGLIHRDPGSRSCSTCDPLELILHFISPESIAAAELAHKERDNGQISLFF